MSISAIDLFTLGVLFQSTQLLGRNISKPAIFGITAALIVALLGMVPAIDGGPYHYGEHVFVSLCIFIAAFTGIFGRVLLVTIGARSLLTLNLLVIAYVYDILGLSIPLYLFASFAFVVFVLGANDWDTRYGVRLLLYCYHLVLTILILSLPFAFGDLFNLFTSDLQVPSVMQSFLLGMAFMYLAVQVSFLVRTVPINYADTTDPVKVRERKEHRDMLASHYMTQQHDGVKNAIILILIGTFLFVNGIWEVVNTETLVIGICALLPLIQPQASGVQQKSTL